jgi:hypothetical protein
MSKLRNKKIRYNNVFLQEFCKEHNITLLMDYSNENINRDSIIEGKCKSDNCNENFSKGFRSIIKIGGYCVKCIKYNRNEKVKYTCLEKYGVENPNKLQDVKDRIKNTCLEKYGVEFSLQSKEVRDKAKETILDIYGVVHISQSQNFKEKFKETCLKNYGVEFVTQHPEIFEKAMKNAYKLKDYTLPSGNIIKIQGYEHYALDELLQDGILEEDIINGCKNVPEIWYTDENNKKHRHYVDIFIPSLNRCIEVKSTWTAEKKKDFIFLKQQAGKELGYNYEIWVYNGKGEKIECYK